jgi:5-methyltetrahydrofolate--homocysteine methyltransferase
MQLPLILDGATGTRLQKAGMPDGAGTEEWVLEHPEVLAEIQRSYVRAGSQVLLTPTFGANAYKLRDRGIPDSQYIDYNYRLAMITKEAADGGVLVAGDIAPTGRLPYPYGDASMDSLISAYLVQAEGLEKAGVDLFIIETMMSLADARAAVMAVKQISEKPVFVTFTCDENGRILTGGAVEAALITMQSMGVDAFGLNCSSGPDTMLDNIRRLTPYAKLPLIAKPNAGLPKLLNGRTVFDMAPEAFCMRVPEMAAAGVSVFGGCCGTDEEHIAALAEAVSNLNASDFAPPAGTGTEYLASEREVFEITPDLGEGDFIRCSADLQDDILDLQEEEKAVRISIDDEDGLKEFADALHVIKAPLVLRGKPELVERAKLLYNGVPLCV